MPRKLKTYQTSLGFFELAIAAPSMKAALQAWGSKSNLFHQGFAKEARDPAIIAVTMAKPGVVLRRAVGTNDTFNENAALPRDLGVHPVKRATTKARPPEKEPRALKLDDKATVAAALAFEREEKRRERERQKELAAQERQRKQRELANTGPPTRGPAMRPTRVRSSCSSPSRCTRSPCATCRRSARA
jgi:colicin import membrane protein